MATGYAEDHKGGSVGYRARLRTVSVLLCLQKEARDHQGAVLVTSLDCGPQWCLCGYSGSMRDIRALRMASM